MADDHPEHQDDARDPNTPDPSIGGEETDAARAAERALDGAQHAADRLDEATRAEQGDAGQGGQPADAGAGTPAGAPSGESATPSSGSAAGVGTSEGSAGGGDESAGDAAEGDAQSPPNIDLPNFQRVMDDVGASGIDLLRDVELNVKIELGRTHMLVEDVLGLNDGSVVELNKLAGDPVDVYVNDRLVARGEVLVLSENFCVRINEIVANVADEIGADDTDTTTATEETGTSHAEAQPASADPGNGTGTGESEGPTGYGG